MTFISNFKFLIFTGLFLMSLDSFANDALPNCYKFIVEGPERTTSVISPTTQEWCYQDLDYPAGSVLIYNVGSGIVKPELSLIVDHEGIVTHGSLRAGEISIHRFISRDYNPFPVPLERPNTFVSTVPSESIVMLESKAKTVSQLTAKNISTAEISLEEGVFEVNVPDTALPFRGYWWPYDKQPLSGTTSSPLAKYDSYVRSRTGVSPFAASWESARHKFKNILWEGHCNGWAASAILRAEPKLARRAPGSETLFTVADQKGILAEKDYCATVAFFGKRNKGRRGDNPRDIVPMLFHKTLTYYIGQLAKPVVLDYHSGSAVDNHIASGYKMTVTRRNEFTFDVIAELRMHRYDPSPANEPGSAPTYKRIYKYSLVTDAAGDIVGGTWRTTNPDFLWVPLSPTTCASNNPNVTEEFVSEILQLPEEPASVSSSSSSADLLDLASASCPDLSGSYSCQSDGIPQPLHIAQRTEHGVSVFKVRFNDIENEMIADGTARKIKRGRENLTYTARCGVSELSATIRTVARDYNTAIEVLIRQRPQDTLSLGISMIAKAEGEIQSVHEDLECTRN